jgi:hypothetical protein
MSRLSASGARPVRVVPWTMSCTARSRRWADGSPGTSWPACWATATSKPCRERCSPFRPGSARPSYCASRGPLRAAGRKEDGNQRRGDERPPAPGPAIALLPARSIVPRFSVNHGDASSPGRARRPETTLRASRERKEAMRPLRPDGPVCGLTGRRSKRPPAGRPHPGHSTWRGQTEHER